MEETLDETASISVAARRNGVVANLLYRWRRLMLERGAVAVSGDDDVASNRAVRPMEDRIRELERQLKPQPPECPAKRGQDQAGCVRSCCSIACFCWR